MELTLTIIALIGTLGSLVGTGAGMFAGGPIGGMIGGQIGGQLGGLAGGGTTPMDLTGPLAMMALRQQGRGGGPTPISKPIAPRPVIG